MMGETVSTDRLRELEALVYAPGEFKCPKCGFFLSQFTISAASGAVGDRDHPGEKCPNDGSPLWRVTWKDRAGDHYERAAEEIARVTELKAELLALRASKPEVEKLIEFTGVISKLTPDGVSAVVTLDAEVGGKRLAVINLQTVGRLKLVSSGRYYNGHPVSGTAVRGPDALLAVTIEAASLEGNRDER